ncbi:glycosyltransferase family 2 protein [Bacteroidia bacterium]|mgnify:CR=1 FL=1|nr:glycosyltransferase family 2 protein [Bacteroidia bacterium]MDB4173645.1 glycosyltransferase family 2 protein [Bacteroidia bacterium]
MLSVILPIYNEQDGLNAFTQELVGVLQQHSVAYELIFVNDGSTDNSLSAIKGICAASPHAKYINLSRNFGHQVAVSAGIDYAKGDEVLLMDSDGQDPPEVVPALLKQMEQGYDVVYAKRESRAKESFLKKFTAKVFYKLLNRITRIDIPIDTGDFRVMNRKVTNALKQMPEKQRYLRGQIAWLGFNQTYITYERKGRNTGETGYTYGKMITLALDAITSFSNWPLRVATLSGFACAALGLVLIMYTLYSRFVLGVYQPGWASLMITIVFLGGIQLLGIGMIGEYISRISDNVKNRPLYLVDETNIDA